MTMAPMLNLLYKVSAVANIAIVTSILKAGNITARQDL